MKLEVNGVLYELTDDKELALFRLFSSLIERMYLGLPEEIQFFVKMGVRKMLKHQEDESRRLEGKEASLKFRPAKKQDPVIHLLSIVGVEGRRGFHDTTIILETSADCITNFQIVNGREGEGRGQMVVDGNQWEREDNGVEIPGLFLHSPVPYDAALGT